MDPSYLYVKKNGSQLFQARKTVLQQFGKKNKKFTNRWSKKKDDDCYFAPEKLFRSYLEREKFCT